MIAASRMMTTAFMIHQSNPSPPLGQAPQQAPASAARRHAPTIAAIAAIALFLSAAGWQRARMHDKEALRAQLDAAAAAPAIALPQALPDWSALRFRPVALSGHYDAPHQVLIDNRIDAGRVGFHVVTPLVLDDGRAVLVDRGFVAAGATRTDLPVVPVPAGEVAVRGRIDLPGRYFEFARAGPAGNVWQNLDPARFAAATGIAVLPVVVLQDARDAPRDGLARNWPAPDVGVDMHRSYMLQWLAFAALTLGLWIWHGIHRR